MDFYVIWKLANPPIYGLAPSCGLVHMVKLVDLFTHLFPHLLNLLRAHLLPHLRVQLVLVLRVATVTVATVSPVAAVQQALHVVQHMLRERRV